jgi:MFS transporter, DHA2 family, multidrug resistance protein
LPTILLQGFALGPTILAASNVAMSNVAPVDVNDVQTAYYFIRQLGNTFGVTTVTVLLDRRMTFHSSRILDYSNRLDPTVTSTLARYAMLVHRNGGGGSNPALGALQLFQANVITQSRLLAYIDIYFGLAAIAATGLLFLILAQIKGNKTVQHHFHGW